MIVYKSSDVSTNVEFSDNRHQAYLTMDNNTGPDVPDIAKSCIHTATMAVCTVLVIFVLFLGCTGNGVVLFNALTTKRMRHNFDLLVINLAGADFIMCTCLSPIFLFLLFSDSTIPRVFCGSIMFLGVTSGLLSLLSIVCIAFHRYCRMIGRLKQSLTLSQTSVVIVVVWMTSVTVALGGTFFVTSSWEEGMINKCQSVITGDSVNTVTSNFVLYFLSPTTMVSLTVIILCYALMARIVRTQSCNEFVGAAIRNVDYLNETNREQLTTDSHCSNNEIANNSPPPGVESQMDNGSRAITMCFVVSITVALCWAPLVISQFIELVTGESIILYQVKLCGIALIFLNSALDPYLYGQTNGRIKHKYAVILYNFARCECRFQRRTQIKRTNKPQALAGPVQSAPFTQDTNSVLLGCQESECPECLMTSFPLRQGRCYQNNINFSQNLLLINHHEGDYTTKLASNDIFNDEIY